MPRLDELQRDEAYRACCLAISAAGAQRESLYLARLALLLMEGGGGLARRLRLEGRRWGETVCAS